MANPDDKTEGSAEDFVDISPREAEQAKFDSVKDAHSKGYRHRLFVGHGATASVIRHFHTATQRDIGSFTSRSARGQNSSSPTPSNSSKPASKPPSPAKPPPKS